MLRISQRLTEPRSAELHLVLPFEQRSRSRFRALLDSGEEVGVLLSRGQILRGGDLLLTDDGRVVEVTAAPELVSTLRTPDPRLLARAAFHLGNRHVALEIGTGWLRYRHDHVLDEMTRRLGGDLTVEQAPFEPEAGAYHEHEHEHGPGHDHEH